VDAVGFNGDREMIVRTALRLKLFLAALAGEDKAALSDCPRQAIAGQ